MLQVTTMSNTKNSKKGHLKKNSYYYYYFLFYKILWGCGGGAFTEKEGTLLLLALLLQSCRLAAGDGVALSGNRCSGQLLPSRKRLDEGWLALLCFAFAFDARFIFFPRLSLHPTLGTHSLFLYFFSLSLQTFLWPCDVLKKRLWIARSQTSLEVRESLFDVNIVSRKIARGALCWRSKKKPTKRSSTFTSMWIFFQLKCSFLGSPRFLTTS